MPRQLAPIETSSPLGVTRLLWHATQSLDGANIEMRAGVFDRGGSVRPVDCAVPACGVASKTTHSHADAAARIETRPLRHFQNSKKPPSNQSQTR